jgi:hypothetical protein
MLEVFISKIDILGLFGGVDLSKLNNDGEINNNLTERNMNFTERY